MNFNEKYKSYKEAFEIQFNKKIESINSANATLKDAMLYSLKAGGKRIRPVLMLATADALMLDLDKVMDFAIAIECIHTYSLIHDDLPAMDNDDYRRGKLTNHKVYGEAMAILAGDALLNYAYEIILRAINSTQTLSAGRLLSLYAGAFGMVGGQAIDMLSNDTLNESELNQLHLNKTGRLLMACSLVPSCLQDNLYFDNLSNFSKNLGLLFQITDDILDVTSSVEVLGKSINKDSKDKKLTFVSLYGLEGAKLKAEEVYNLALDAIKGVDNSEFLIELLAFIKNRESWDETW